MENKNFCEKGREVTMTSLFFSPRSTTKRTARAIAKGWGKATERDLIGSPLTETLEVPAEEPLLVCLPVYAGRIPTVCRTMLETHLKGSGGPAVAVAVYGNRAYDDALLELADLLEEKGFHVVAAGAFIGRHSIFTKVADGRPDEADLALMEEFGGRCRAAAEGFDPAAPKKLDLPGDPAYRDREGKRVPIKPDCNDRCMKCYACFRSCPARAIPEDAPWTTDTDKCISCGACIYLCPTKARDFRGLAYDAAAKVFELKNAKRREPELFF